MSKRQIGTNSKETSRMAGVLEDPRWERLVSGQATPAEVAELCAWAQQSRLARKVWELYRPSFDKEKEAMAATLLRTLKQHGKDDKVWRSAKLAAMAVDKPQDRRTMSRHQARVRENSAKPDSHESVLGGIELRRSITELNRKPRDPIFSSGTKPAPVSIKIESVGKGLVGRRDLSGTTSSRITLTKDAVDVPAVRSVAEVRTPSELQEHMTVLDRRLRQTRFGMGMALLVCGVLCGFVVARLESVQMYQIGVSSDLSRPNVVGATPPPYAVPSTSGVIPMLTRIEPEPADVAASAAPPNLAPSAGARRYPHIVGRQATASPPFKAMNP